MAGTYSILDYEGKRKEVSEAREREESATREKAREEESAAREREAKNRNFSDKAPENSAHFPKVSLSVRGIIWALAVLVTVLVAIIVGFIVYSSTNHINCG